MMGDCTSGELLFPWVCLMLLSSVESLNWTVQPTNPTVVEKGQDVSLTWRYTLTAEEQTKSQSSFLVKWQKFNDSSFDDLAFRLKINLLTNPVFEEQAPHIVVDRATGTDFASLKINNVVISDEGIYKILVSAGGAGNTIDTEQRLNFTVLVPPEIRNVSSNQDICEGSLVTLSCNATGKPTPSITWTRVEANGSDSAPLPAVDGTYLINNITRSSNGMMYRCTAENGVGTVNRTVQVAVRYPPLVDRIVNSSNTVIEGGSFNMTCEASGDPIPYNYTWITVDSNPIQRRYGNILAFSNINRSDAGDYRCEVVNQCGKDSRVQSVDRVLYKPEHVTLNLNISSNKVCAVSVVNFTCKAEAANPEVHTYTLYENDSMAQNIERPGVWIKTLNTSGHYIYRCKANNTIDAVDSNQRTLTVEVPAKVLNVSNPITVTEGRNVSLSCNFSAFSPPSVSWVNTRNGQMNHGRSWSLRNIHRNYTGEYICTASNACGNDSKATNIDVQYKPENVMLNVNISSYKVCAVTVVNFTCKAEAANPEVHTYTLYENDSIVQNMERPGVWIKTLNTSGLYIYRCKAVNTIDAVDSNQRTLTVEVPAKVLDVSNLINVTEGRNVTLSCNVSAFSPLSVSWVNTRNGEMNHGHTWPLLNISRNYAGNYSCTASNACGNDSKTTNINVQYSPSATSSGLTKKVELGKNFSYPCPVDGNPQPTITWYRGREPSLTQLYGGKNLKLPVPELSDSNWYTCFASNSLGNATATVELIVVEFSQSWLSLRIINQIWSVASVSQVEQDFPARVLQAYGKGKGLESVNINGTRPGSIIVDLVLRFSQSVNDNDVISTLKTAAEQDKFGPFTVNPDSIRITGPEPSSQSTKTTKGTEPSTKRPSCEKSSFEDENCKIIWWKVIVIVVAIVLLIVLVIVIVACFIHKKRKCRKDPRIHSNECEENLGYAHSGPPSANGTDGGRQQQAAAAAPTCAVVDKSKKTRKQKEEKPPEYAVVDKSKKKKKDEKEDCTYAQVDMSKKTSKKQQPRNADGLLYSDLGDFERPQMPPVSTSPETLPPVKKPPAYEATQYADITEFLKGGATLPKERNSQGMEMQPQAAPPANGNSQGNEVKPQGANKGESGVPPKESKL